MEFLLAWSWTFAPALVLVVLLALVDPVGLWLEKRIRLDRYPYRPMTNAERRSHWAARYHLTAEPMGNAYFSFPARTEKRILFPQKVAEALRLSWAPPEIEAHGTGATREGAK